MTDSIFRRINREDYRREVARYFPYGYTGHPRKIFLPALLVMALSMLYGFCLSLLYNNNKQWFEAVISWTRPWLEDQLIVHVPSINKISENLADYGHSEFIPLAQHIYAVSIPFAVMTIIAGFFYVWSVRATPARQKRVFIMSCNRVNIDYRIMIFVLLLGELLFLYAGYDHWYEGVLEDGESRSSGYDLDGLLLYSRTSFASCGILFLACTSALMVAGGIISIYYGLRRWYVNIRQQINIRRRNSAFSSAE